MYQPDEDVISSEDDSESSSESEYYSSSDEFDEDPDIDTRMRRTSEFYRDSVKKCQDDELSADLCAVNIGLIIMADDIQVAKDVLEKHPLLLNNLTTKSFIKYLNSGIDKLYLYLRDTGGRVLKDKVLYHGLKYGSIPVMRWCSNHVQPTKYNVGLIRQYLSSVSEDIASQSTYWKDL